VVEGARLESVYALITHRGFEPLSLRQISKYKKAPKGAFLWAIINALMLSDARLFVAETLEGVEAA
jgi:hypothetical protein